MKRSFIKIDREHFTQARRSCLEPGACSVVKGARRRTVSLWRTKVPKPTLTYSFTGGSKWTLSARLSAFLPRLHPWVSCRRNHEGLPVTKMGHTTRIPKHKLHAWIEDHTA